MSHNKNTKERIIEVAIECFGSHGYEGASMRLIAEKSGVSKPAIYYYFPDKEKLFVGIMEYVGQKYQKDLEEIKNSAKNAREKLNDILVSRFLQFKDREKVRRFMNTIFSSGIKIHKHIDHRKLFQRQEKIIVDIIQQGIDEGTFRRDMDVKVFLYSIIGTMNLFTRDHILDETPLIDKALADKILNQFVEGIGK